MPFKSQAQRKKFYELAEQGKISHAEVAKWERETGGRKLPDRVSPKKQNKAPKGGRR